MGHLNDSDAEYAYVQAARALLDAVLSDIRQQAAPAAGMSTMAHTAYGLTVSATGGQSVTYTQQGSAADQLSAKIQQLGALLQCTTGDQGEAFRAMDGKLQDHVMWLANDLAVEIELLTDLLIEGAAQ